MKEHTPTQLHGLNGFEVQVKRDDLFLEDCQPDCPPLAKLRGAYPLLKKLKEKEGLRKVAVFDTRISKAGQGIAFISKELGLECLVGFPLLKGSVFSESHKIARRLGAELCPLKAGRTAVCYGTFAKVARDRGYHLMPLGLVCDETVHAVSLEAYTTLEVLGSLGINIKTIVLSTGTGTIATGVHLGTMGDAKVIGVSCGMATHKQVGRMRQLAYPKALHWDYLQLIEPEYDYYTALDTSECPFPTSPYYDMKAWVWLRENIEKLEHPVMFWNIGV